MNCRECQRDMSPCLDGRLPSGRRSVVMEHLEACEECAKLWSEFQQAQELVLRMPVRPVSPDFHTRLWERIKAGEGTPPAVFAEPMPLATKVRYVLTGAVAAALLLVFINGWMPGSGEGTPGDVENVADFGEKPPAFDNSFPFDPPVWATQAAMEVAQNSRDLGRNFQKLQGLPPDQLDESTLWKIRENARRVRSVGRVLLFLQRNQHVELSRESEVTLRFFGSSRELGRLGSMHNRRELEATLSPVMRELRILEQLPQEMKVRLTYRPEERLDFQRRAAEWLVEDREPLNVFRIHVSGQPGTLELELFDRLRNQLSGSAGRGATWRFSIIPPRESK